jgi:hypothetical protein
MNQEQPNQQINKEISKEQIPEIDERKMKEYISKQETGYWVRIIGKAVIILIIIMFVTSSVGPALTDGGKGGVFFNITIILTLAIGIILILFGYLLKHVKKEDKEAYKLYLQKISINKTNLKPKLKPEQIAKKIKKANRFFYSAIIIVIIYLILQFILSKI